MPAARSLNYLVRPPQQRRRDRQAEGLGGLAVDDQLELRRLLDGQVGGLSAAQDLVHIGGGAPPQIAETRPIADEVARIDKLPGAVACGKAVLRCKVQMRSSMEKTHRVWQYEQRLRAFSDHRSECAVVRAGTARLYDLKLHSQRATRHHRFSQQGAVLWMPRIPEDSHPGDLRDDLLQQLQLFGDDSQPDTVAQPRDVPARPRQACDDPAPDRIAKARH